jgi:DNA invertase Pin-like site-specific DNA recombinase
MQSDKPRRLDAYVRVSKVGDRAGAQFISPQQQLDRIQQWAGMHGHTIVKTWEELDVSGGTIDRPLLNQVMGRIRAGETDGVVVAYLSRFGRSLVGALSLIQEIDQHGALFASVADGFDTRTPTGRLTLNILLSLAQWELERLREQFMDARLRALKRGHHMGRVPPSGYLRRDERDSHGRLLADQDGRLYPDPSRERFIRGIFERRAAGESLSAIYAWLKAEGATTPKGHPFSTSHISQILRNVVYLGVLDDSSTDERHEGAHPPLVDRATWLAAQERHGTSFRTKSSGLLTGLCRCAGCRYTSRYMNSHHNRVYYCNRQLGHHDCPAPTSIRANTATREYVDRRTVQGLEDYVVEKVFERLPEIEAHAYGDDSGIDELTQAAAKATDALRIHGIDVELEEAIGRDAYLARGRVLRQEAEEAIRERDDALARSAAHDMPARTLRDDWETMTLAARRDALSKVIRCVFVRPPARRKTHDGASGSRVHIVWFDDPEVDIPRQGRRDYFMRPFVFPGADSPDGLGELSA